MANLIKYPALICSITLSFLLLNSCGYESSPRHKKKKARKEQEKAYYELKKKIPKEHIPEFHYRKFDGGWYKRFRRYPLLDVPYVKGQKLPVIVEKEIEGDSLDLPYSSFIRKNYTHLLEKRGLEFEKFHRTELRKTPELSDYCRHTFKWRPVSQYFEGARYDRDGKPECLRSRVPLFFDQYVYVTFREWDIYTAPNPQNGEYSQSKYPYINVRMLAYIPNQPYNKDDRGGLIYDQTYHDLKSNQNFQKIKFIEDLVKEIYVGPNLPSGFEE